MRTNCPVCSKPLSAGVHVCTGCGWQGAGLKPGGVQTGGARQSSANKSILKQMAIASAGLLLFVMHFSKWGSHSVSVVYLKAAQVTRLAGPIQHKKLFNICMKLKNYDCVESSLKSFYHSTKDSEQLKKLAGFQLRMKKDQASLKSYSEYFKQGGYDKQAAYNFAKLLDQFNQKEKALKYYNKILSAQKKNVLQVSVVRNKIDLLVRMNRKAQARRVIKKYAPLAKTSGNYIKQEINRWKQRVNQG